MNEESHNPNIDPELEARIVALVLGEASDFERDQLNCIIAQQPELAAFKLQMQSVHGLLEHVGAGEFVVPDEDWKLSTDKRSAVMAVISGTAQDQPARQDVSNSVEPRVAIKRSWLWNLTKIAAVFCVAGFFALMAMPRRYNARSVNSMKQLGLATHDYHESASIDNASDYANGHTPMLGGTRLQYDVVAGGVTLDTEQPQGSTWTDFDGKQTKSALSAIRATLDVDGRLPSSHYLDDDVEYFPATPDSTFGEAGARRGFGAVEGYARPSTSTGIAAIPAPPAVVDSAQIADYESAWAFRSLTVDSPPANATKAPATPSPALESDKNGAVEGAQIEFVPEQRQVIVRGSRRDVERVKSLIDELSSTIASQSEGQKSSERKPAEENAESGESAAMSELSLPTFAQTGPSTTVVVPDGGTVLLGGIGRKFLAPPKPSLSDGQESDADHGEGGAIGGQGLSDDFVTAESMRGQPGNKVATPTAAGMLDRLDADITDSKSPSDGYAGGSGGGGLGGGGLGGGGGGESVPQPDAIALQEIDRFSSFEDRWEGKTPAQGMISSGVASTDLSAAIDFFDPKKSDSAPVASSKPSPANKMMDVAADFSNTERSTAAKQNKDFIKGRIAMPNLDLAAPGGDDGVLNNSGAQANGSFFYVPAPVTGTAISPPSGPGLPLHESAPGASKVGQAVPDSGKELESFAKNRQMSDPSPELPAAVTRLRSELPSGTEKAAAETLKFKAEEKLKEEQVEWGRSVDRLKATKNFQSQATSTWGTRFDRGWLDSLPAPVKRMAAPAGLNEKIAEHEAFSTFSLHVSDVSFKLALAALARGEWPEAAKIRIEEFVNAFDYGDPMPCHGERVACRVEQSIHPFVQQRNLLRVSMRTAAAGRASNTPLRLTFLLDNSGSMERIDRQQTVRRAFALLAQQLTPIDQVTLISFARQPRLLADKVSGAESARLVKLIEDLPSEGGTNIEAALQLAFEKAREQQTDGAQNRIILLTDGAVNLGDAKPESLSRMITTMRAAGIAFDAAGISAEGLNDEVLEALTRKGDGRYYLLDSLEAADDGFARQIAGALRPSAKNVKVQIEFNPKRVGRYKLLGFEKHILKKEDFRNDTVDAAEMAAAEAGVALYQFEAKPDGEGDVGSVSVRFRDLSTGQMIENRWPIPYEADAPRPDQAAPSLRIATSAALLAAKLRGEPLGETVDLQALSHLLSGLPEQDRNHKRVQQLQQMIGQARQLSEK